MVACARQGIQVDDHLRTQLLQWAGLLVAVRLSCDAAQEASGQRKYRVGDSAFTGAERLPCGIHLGWRLCLVGGVLGAALVAATYLEEMSGFWSSSGLWFSPLLYYGSTLSAVRIGDENDERSNHLGKDAIYNETANTNFRNLFLFI